MRKLLFFVLASLFVVLVLTAAGGTRSGDASIPGDADVRRAVARAVPYLEREGVAWIDEHGCVSCHQVPAMLWGLHAARRAGVAVDDDKLAKWTRWSFERLNGKESNNVDGMHQLLAGGVATGEEAAKLVAHVARDQGDDGSWEPGGQLPGQRRPEDETRRVSTAWSVLALHGADGDAAALARGQERLAAWRAEDDEAKSQEALVVELLLAERSDDGERAAALRARLLQGRNPDGGWPWLRGEASDAFATGQALYALGEHAPPEVVARARRFLLDSQQDDGSWAVRSTLRREEGVTPTASFWGTGWAVVGLARTLAED